MKTATTPTPPRSAAGFILAAAAGGALTGAADGAGALYSTLTRAGALWALLFTTSAMALWGAALGLLAWAAARYLAQASPYRLKLAAVAAITPAAFIMSPGWPMGAVAAFSLLIFLAGWRHGAERLLAAYLFWSILVFILGAFFNSPTLLLAFTMAEAQALTIGIAALLLGVSWLLVAGLAGYQRPRSARFALFAFAALALFMFLNKLSSLFLIRLFGFGGMDSLRLAILLMMTASACVVTAPLARLMPRRYAAPALLAAVIALFAITNTFAMARDGAASFILNRAPHTGHALVALASRWDRDHDHYSPLFGFGDCDDRDPARNPFMRDIPGDGIDQNCYNGDAAAMRHDYFSRLPPEIVPPGHRPPRRPRTVILLVVDTLRADAVSTDPAGPTPTLAAWANGGMYFTNAYAQSNHTTESVPYFLQAGFRAMPWVNDELMLARLLSRAKVATAGVIQPGAPEWWGEFPLESKLFGFDKLLRPPPDVWAWSLERTMDEVTGVMDAPGDDDRFVYVHLENMHDTIFNSAGAMVKNMKGGIGGLLMLWDTAGLVNGYRKAYHTLARQVDTALGALAAALPRWRENRDVLLIVTSDHGEEIYEHGGLFHFGAMYEETLRVPLILYGDGVAPRRVETPAPLYRIPSTALGYLGFGGGFVRDLDLIAKPDAAFPVFAAFAQYYSPWRRVVAAREGDLKLILNSAEGREELYDLAAGPGERVNLAGAEGYAEKAAPLRRIMDATLSEISRRGP